MESNKIIECLKDSNFIAAPFGSRAREEDILVFPPFVDFTQIGSTVLEFIHCTDNLKALGDTTLIIKHEHRAFAPPEARLCHLLFYPTTKHIALLELPSVISSILSVVTISDQDVELASIARNYLAANPKPLVFDAVSYHLARYDDIALTSLFYALTDKPVLPLRVLANNLSYAFRFMASEYLLRLSPKPNVQKTSWTEVIETLRSTHIISKNTIDFLSKIKRNSRRLTAEEIIRVSREYLVSRDKWVHEMLGSNGGAHEYLG